MSYEGLSKNVFQRVSLQGGFETSLARQTGTWPVYQIETSPKLQIWISLGWSNRIFRGRSWDTGGGRPQDVHRTNFCWLGVYVCVCVCVCTGYSVLTRRLG